MNDTVIDVVISVAKKDLSKLQFCVDGLIFHSKNSISNIYILSSDKSASDYLSTDVPVYYINDDQYPVPKEEISKILGNQRFSSGYENYYFQQLLKLYIFRAIPDLLDCVLFLDSDFIISSKIQFLDDAGKHLMSYGYPFLWLMNTKDYPESVNHIHASHAARLIPEWKVQHPYSGMHHHMVFHREILSALLAIVEEQHKLPFWKAFINTIDIDSGKWNAASEYVIYHHFSLSYYPEKIQLRHLKTCDIIYDVQNSKLFPNYFRKIIDPQCFHAVGYHAFIALRERLQTMDYIPDFQKKIMLQSDNPCFKLILDDGVLSISNI
jgi:hypothetical protein